MDKNIYKNYLAILREEMIPAMGCTEPIALAYGAARAREILGKEPERIVAKCSGNIIKNVRCVIIPNSGGLKGIPAGVILGAVAGDASLNMEVLSKVDEKGRARCRELLEADICKVELLDTPVVLHIIIEMYAGEDAVSLEIKYDHINVTRISKNGEILLDADKAVEEKEETDRGLLNLEDIREFADTVELSDVKELLDAQIRSNMAIAHEGMTGKYGLGIGRVIRENYSHDMLTRMRSLTAAASEARMGGCDMPVVINSGSGNQGITCSVPVIEYARELCSGDEKMYRALTLSNLVAIHQKTGIGRLSAFCGAVCAGVAAGAGIAYLRGGGFKEIAHTVVNGLAIVSGIVCDGAKPSCAAKIAASVNAGILGYEMYVRGQQFYGGDGIVTKGADNTIRNIGRLGKEGMAGTNDEIIKIMIE